MRSSEVERGGICILARGLGEGKYISAQPL
jgi:hypothetical protein